MSRITLFLCLILACSPAWAADSPPEFIEGRVIDAEGSPVANVDVATFWSANGTKGYEKRKSPDLTKSDEVALFWANVGRMDPFGLITRHAKTDATGTFRVESRPSNHHVVVMDQDRTRGALGVVPVGQEGQPITLRLGSLVRVQGKIRGPETDEKPAWTHVYTLRREEPERPLDNYRVSSCGSFAADFAMLLPPGHYQLHAYNDPRTGEVQPYPELTIDGTEGVIDLGTLRLSRATEAIVPRMERIKTEKHLLSLKDLIGQSPPPVFANDARSLPRDWQPGRSTGKWQFLYFWGMGCVPCLKNDIPALIQFYDDHQGQADQFEIVTMFLDPDEKIQSIGDLEKAMKPLVSHVWGKPLPFPILVDPSYRTCESWGLSGFGEKVLINPQGKIVAGDLETLKGILDKK